MKFHFAIMLSTAMHITAAIVMSQHIAKANPISEQSVLWVTFKQPLETVSSSNIERGPLSDQSIPLNPFSDYLSEQDVEIKALPSSNIDHTELNDIFVSGLPIKIRIYISGEGRVVKIDRLDTLAQDFQLQEALEKILLAMSFLPAQKNGMAVNSYQEVAFSFN